ncbi:MAG TPA: 4Fe-4S binding protein [bacterium]|nr:4Fe-4S binding protein [bacterium]
MANEKAPIHYVCTPEKAEELVGAHDRFWVCNCGCREAHGGCGRSRMDVCLMFNPADPGSGSGKREISSEEAWAILEEASDKHLVTRPFRNEDRTATDGICFCCDDCCWYFVRPEEKCDKGELVAQTDWDSCTHCGACVDVCYFKARKLDGGKLVVDLAACYGCGLCRDVCPEECVEMVPRA